MTTSLLQYIYGVPKYAIKQNIEQGDAEKVLDFVAAFMENIDKKTASSFTFLNARMAFNQFKDIDLLIYKGSHQALQRSVIRIAQSTTLAVIRNGMILKTTVAQW